MRRKIVLTTLTVSLFTVLLISCKHEPTLSSDAPTVCFQEQIYPLIKSNCGILGCHAAASHDEGPVLATYDDIRGQVTPNKPNQSKLYKAVTGGAEEFMPPSPRPALTQEQINLISIWILEGAENNSCPDPLCDTTNVSYTTNIQPLLNTWCVGCHGGNSPEAGVLLETYDEVLTQVNNGQLYGAVTWAPNLVPMPFESNQLSDCSIAMVRIWIEGGAQNN